MSQNVYVITVEETEQFFRESIFPNGIYLSTTLELTEEMIIDMASKCLVEYFYVVCADAKITIETDFSFEPAAGEEEYMHIWDNDKTIRLFNKEMVLANPKGFTDSALLSGIIKLKNHTRPLYANPMFDIVFLSYDEPYAEENFARLKSRYPRIKRVKGIKGIFNAHLAAAHLSETDMFYVVDADADVLPTFKFNHYVDMFNRLSVHVWYSKNPINDLEYGYGGVKLFPRASLLEYVGDPVDFTTSVSKHLKIVPEVSNLTRFDTDPYTVWRSAFREAVKLSSKIIPGQENSETEERLKIWCTVGNGEFGNFALMGANEGAEFGRTNFDKLDQLKLINDFEWLEKRFNS